MGQAHDHVDITFGLTFQPCSRLSLALTTRNLIKVSHTSDGEQKRDEEVEKKRARKYTRYYYTNLIQRQLEHCVKAK